MATTSIEWTEISDANRYRINNIGEIIGPTQKLLRPMKSESGHLYVFINRKKRFVHRLVLEAFCGRCPNGMECRHLDGDPSNNNISNLRWGTKKENVEDRRRHGRMPVPHLSQFTKLKPKDIPVIRLLHENGNSSRSIGKIFHTSHVTIQKIVRDERWKGY